MVLFSMQVPAIPRNVEPLTVAANSADRLIPPAPNLLA
jgi:hypothetical protein